MRVANGNMRVADDNMCIANDNLFKAGANMWKATGSLQKLSECSFEGKCVESFEILTGCAVNRFGVSLDHRGESAEAIIRRVKLVIAHRTRII